MLRPVQGVFFDVDGVLLDSLPQHLAICRAYAEKFRLNVQMPSVDEFRRRVSQGTKVSPMRDFFLAVGFPKEVVDEAVAGMGPVVAGRYREALERSSYDGMVNYYRANYNRERGGEMPNLAMPVLQFHGLKDSAVDKDGLKGTWDWVDADYTLVTIPSSGHFVQWDAAEIVSQTMKSWLNARD